MIKNKFILRPGKKNHKVSTLFKNFYNGKTFNGSSKPNP